MEKKIEARTWSGGKVIFLKELAIWILGIQLEKLGQFNLFDMVIEELEFEIKQWILYEFHITYSIIIPQINDI